MRSSAGYYPMNFTTQAAEDILSKIERDPAEVRHWRQLLILCFDQKSIETLQTLQVIVAAIEQIWNQTRQKAKEAYEEARLKQRSTGSKEPLPSTTVHSVHAEHRGKRKLSSNWRSRRNRRRCFTASDFTWRRISICRSRPGRSTNAPWRSSPTTARSSKRSLDGLKRLNARIAKPRRKTRRSRPTWTR